MQSERTLGNSRDEGETLRHCFCPIACQGPPRLIWPLSGRRRLSMLRGSGLDSIKIVADPLSLSAGINHPVVCRSTLKESVDIMHCAV